METRNFCRSRVAAILGASFLLFSSTHATIFSLISWSLAQVRFTKPFSDTPRAVYLGDKPGRDADHRGGLFTDRQIIDLNKIAVQNALEWNSSALVAGGYAFAPSINGMQYCGQAKSWESQLGEVNSNTGNRMMSIPIVGWSGRGGTTFSLGVIYNSKANLTTSAGYGWRFSYEAKVTQTSDEVGDISGATVTWGDGTTHSYTSPDVGATYVAPIGVYDKLVLTGTTWTITHKDQTKMNFNAGGYSTSQVDRAGNTITIGRDGSNKINAITDPSGRAITITNTSGYATSLTDPLGRTWSFARDGSNNLTSASMPSLGGTVR